MKLKQISSNPDLLNIASIEVSQVAGPGSRIVIWVQGCSIRCKYCINQDFLPFRPNKLMEVKKVFEFISNTPNIEGVTYSGGEPFDQAQGLYELSKLIKETGLSIMSYSGYKYEELKNSNDKYKRLLLSMLDILIDGRYEYSQAAPLLWRGSTNQKVYFLNPIYEQYREIVNNTELQIEFSLNSLENQLTIKGNFNQALIKKIKNRLKSYGIDL